MRQRLLIAPIAALFTVVAAVGFLGCSKDKTTNPYGGGTGGTTLDVPLAANGTGQATFTTAGTFVYKCSIHPTMMRDDTVLVSPSFSVTDVNVTVTGTAHPGFNPQTVGIPPGGTVHWSNPTGTPHHVVNQ